ncbi:IclR family transcriptional regulator [Nocardiopsis sp. CT-R113]|uniref:IclR family transcriptional regulator n=1 Tax=Nocardiopsis codii TaxID=3065942 RepID=A0ABU7K5T6_9ACTN|nr:IclR family transcriptional regulator [Nocardiopsis sp. CT-R113]MEE2037613.1 IclR family transcriptional regulator [Nocardiopsis sp. CT-R113]
MSADATSGNAGRTTDRLLSVLMVFAETEHATASEVSDATGIPVSTVYRMLDRLSATGFVQRVGTSYGAGPVAVRFAEKYRNGALERTAIGPRLERLSHESGELAAFMVPVGTEALCVDAVEGARVLRCCYTRGAVRPLLRGATAEALLAHLPESRRQEVYAAYRLPAARVRALESEHPRVREQGVAVSESALDEGVWGASAPVLGGSGSLNGVVTVMAPAAVTERRRPYYVRLVKEAARDLSGGTI